MGFLLAGLEAMGLLFAILGAWAIIRVAVFGFQRRKWARSVRPGREDMWSI